MIERVKRGWNTANPGRSDAERDAHVERIMAMQVAEGQLPYPLMQPIPRPRLVFAKRPVHAHAPQSTGDAAAEYSPEVSEEAGESTTNLPTHPPCSSSSASDEDTRSPPSTLEEVKVPDVTLPTLPIDAPMDSRILKACVIYRRQQKAFTASLCNINKVPEDRKVELRSLLGSGGKIIEYHNYERAAHLSRRSDGQQRSNFLVTLLRKIIGRREKVQKWHSRLHVDDTRRDNGPRHQNKIEVLMRTYKILTDGKSYEPNGPRKSRKGPAKRAAQRAAQKQLPLRAAQRQLPLEATQPIRFENAEELHRARVRAWQIADSALSLSLPLFPTMPTTQPPPEGATQTAGGVTTASVAEEKEDLTAGIPTYELKTHAVSVRAQQTADGRLPLPRFSTYELNPHVASFRARQTADGQLPLPLFSTIPTTQPPSEGTTRLAGDAIGAVSPDSEDTDGGEGPISNGSTHEINEPIGEKTHQYAVRYHKHQSRFMEEFLFTAVAEPDEIEHYNLFATGPHQPDGDDDTPVRIERTENYEIAAEIVRRNPDFRPKGRLLQHLRRTIRNRQKAQRWFERLHPRDKRCGKVPGHLAFIEILKRVYQTLSGGRAYSPAKRHRRDRWQALVVVGSMLEQRPG